MSRAGIQSLWDALGQVDGFLATIGGAERGVSEIHGFGLFSTRSRVAGEHVVTLDGQAVPLDVLPAALFTLEWNALSETLLLVRPLRTSYGLVNHASTPNLAIGADGVTVSTLRAIAAGEELTFDYAAQPLPRAYLDAPEGAYLRVPRSPQHTF